MCYFFRKERRYRYRSCKISSPQQLGILVARYSPPLCATEWVVSEWMSEFIIFLFGYGIDKEFIKKVWGWISIAIFPYPYTTAPLLWSIHISRGFPMQRTCWKCCGSWVWWPCLKLRYGKSTVALTWLHHCRFQSHHWRIIAHRLLNGITLMDIFMDRLFLSRRREMLERCIIR